MYVRALLSTSCKSLVSQTGLAIVVKLIILESMSWVREAGTALTVGQANSLIKFSISIPVGSLGGSTKSNMLEIEFMPSV